MSALVGPATGHYSGQVIIDVSNFCQSNIKYFIGRMTTIIHISESGLRPTDQNGRNNGTEIIYEEDSNENMKEAVKFITYQMKASIKEKKFYYFKDVLLQSILPAVSIEEILNEPPPP